LLAATSLRGVNCVDIAATDPDAWLIAHRPLALTIGHGRATLFRTLSVFLPGSPMPPALERIDLRTSAETKALITRAAATAGMSLSAFLLNAAQERAEVLLNEAESLTLTPRDWEAFFTALDNIDQPRPRLTAAMERYRAWRSEQTDA
jgi:uncharacterized protein (DUF1778 family)